MGDRIGGVNVEDEAEDAAFPTAAIKEPDRDQADVASLEANSTLLMAREANQASRAGRRRGWGTAAAASAAAVTVSPPQSTSSTSISAVASVAPGLAALMTAATSEAAGRSLAQAAMSLS